MVRKTTDGSLTSILRKWDFLRVRGGLTNAYTTESFFYAPRGHIGWECHAGGLLDDDSLKDFFRSFDSYHRALA
eukprot:8657096-Lingulodinium_polyedra.AAC.1